jgi:hypothetical protein
MAKISSEAIAASTAALQTRDVQAALHVRNREHGQASGTFDDSVCCTIEFVLGRTPKALADCPQRALEPARIAAAMMELWGTNRLREVTSAADMWDYRLDRGTVAHMLLSHAAYLCRLAQIKETSLRNVEVLPPGLPEDCAVCRHISGRRFTVDDVPELPLVDCTCPDYCKCVLIAVA